MTANDPTPAPAPAPDDPPVPPSAPEPPPAPAPAPETESAPAAPAESTGEPTPAAPPPSFATSAAPPLPVLDSTRAHAIGATQSPTVAAPEERAEINKRNTLILIALIPAICVAILWFGWRPGINFVIAWLMAMLSGSAFKKILHTPAEPSGYRFGRALSSILLIGCLPPNLPWWGAIFGGIGIDYFSRLTAHRPRWARWFRHISPVVPTLLVMYLLGPLIIPGTLYQKKLPILINHPLPFSPLVDDSIEAMIRDPNADTILPTFTWDIESSLDEEAYNQELSHGNLPKVDAVSRASPMAVMRTREPNHADPDIPHPHFDALDGLLGYKSGATLEVASIALLFGILLLCINRILAWRFVLGTVVMVLVAGFLAGPPATGTADRFLHGVEQLTTGGLLLSLFLFAHPTALPVSATASYLQGVLLSILTVLFRRILFQSHLPVLDATLLAVILSALLLPTIESFTRKHLIPGPTPATHTP